MSTPTKRSSLLDAARSEDGLTENRAVTHTTSLSHCLDLFFIAGASRRMSPDAIITMFEGAYGQDPELAVKILFWARDVRGGAGERRFFRIIWSHLLAHRPEVIDSLYPLVPEYGRWDDLFYTTRMAKAFASYLQVNLLNGERLLAKWLPRKGQVASLLRKLWGMGAKEYRKAIVERSQTVEQKMCAGQWDEISYSGVPSVAMHKYRSAFLRNDESRFRSYLDDVSKGEDTIHSDVLFPHKLYQAFIQGKDMQSVQAQWDSLPDYMDTEQENSILPICDVSGSMNQYGGLEMAVSIALGVYISERNKGMFHNGFVTFSGRPKMQFLHGDLRSRFTQLRTADWDMNTDLQAVFSLLLQRANARNVPADHMPKTLLIISDMEFDRCATGTNLDGIRQKYKASGYDMPQVVFWNVRGRIGNVPAQMNEQGIALVSGFSPSILKSVLSGDILDPLHIMLQTISAERYERVTLSGKTNSN